MAEQINDAVEHLLRLVKEYGGERIEEQHRMLPVIEGWVATIVDLAESKGRRQAADGWTLHREEEQWSVWWTSPGGGLNVSVPTDDTDDPEAVARALQADVGGEVKYRWLRTYESRWKLAEPPAGGLLPLTMDGHVRVRRESTAGDGSDVR